MNNDWWKSIERRIAKFFGTTRNPLSGMNSKHTGSDSLHERLFIEVKARQKHTVITLYDDTAVKAKKEKKIPVICLAEKGRPGFWVVVKSEHLQEVAKEVTNDILSTGGEN